MGCLLLVMPSKGKRHCCRLLDKAIKHAYKHVPSEKVWYNKYPQFMYMSSAEKEKQETAIQRDANVGQLQTFNTVSKRSHVDNGN